MLGLGSSVDLVLARNGGPRDRELGHHAPAHMWPRDCAGRIARTACLTSSARLLRDAGRSTWVAA